MSRTVLQVKGLGKRYRLFSSPLHRLYALMGWVDRSKAHWALRDVSFELKAGHCLGVIGDNGAGKSTLLKLLAGTLQPSHGQLHRLGRVTAILELGAGFHPDFTGRDNFQFAGSFMGLTQAHLQTLAQEIIDFSELGDAIDRPVRTYSSGMVVRLAFALVTAVQPDVLVIDEALAVGDQHFQKRCIQRIEAFRQRGCTILFCSHSLYHVRQLCDQVLWLANGQVQALGDTETVLSSYATHVRLQDSTASPGLSDFPEILESQTEVLPANKGAHQGGQHAFLSSAWVATLPVSQASGQAARLRSNDLTVTVQCVIGNSEVPSIGIMLEQHQGVGITSLATHAEGVSPRSLGTQDGRTTWQVVLTFPNLPLHSGQYSLSFYLFDAGGLIVYDEWKDYIQFEWVSPSLTPGLVRLPHQWS